MNISTQDSGSKLEVVMEHDDLIFLVYLESILDNDKQIACYVDRKGLPRRVLKNSSYGIMIINEVEKRGLL